MTILDKIEDLRRGLEIMPIFTDNAIKIKSSFSQGIPKNLDDFSSMKMTKFLNDNLCIIEDLEKTTIPAWFVAYNQKYFARHSLLSKDGIKTKFAQIINSHQSNILRCGFFLGNLGNRNVAQNGATLETANTGSSSTDYADNHLLINKLTPASTIGHLYNQIAVKVVTQSGNINLGIYDDVSGTPTNRLVQSGTIGCPNTSYGWNSVTEIALTSTQTWAAMNHDGASARFTRWAQTNGDLKFKTSEINCVLQNPAPSLTNNASIFQMKIGHS